MSHPELYGLYFVAMTALLVVGGFLIILIGKLIDAVDDAKRLHRPRIRTKIHTRSAVDGHG